MPAKVKPWRPGPQAEVWKDAELRRQCRVQGAKVGRGRICRLLQAVLEFVSEGSRVAGRIWAAMR